MHFDLRCLIGRFQKQRANIVKELIVLEQEKSSKAKFNKPLPCTCIVDPRIRWSDFYFFDHTEDGT